jgi:hypothetical protein
MILQQLNLPGHWLVNCARQAKKTAHASLRGGFFVRVTQMRDA